MPKKITYKEMLSALTVVFAQQDLATLLKTTQPSICRMLVGDQLNNPSEFTAKTIRRLYRRYVVNAKLR